MTDRTFAELKRALRLAGGGVAIGAALLCAPALAEDAEADAAADTPSAEDVVEAAPASAWRPVDPENTLYLELKSGRVVVEMRPDFAPIHVERIKTLARQGFYDGLTFHRVIPDFMAQGGDPTGTGAGASELPDIPGEFVRLAGEEVKIDAAGRSEFAPQAGFVDGFPVSAQDEMVRLARMDGKIKMWPRHCPGVASMARANDPNSANSQFFLMFGDARQGLDQTYSAWGWVVDGMDRVMAIAPGEPPETPDKIISARVAADLPAAERTNVEVMATSSEAFASYAKAKGAFSDSGRTQDICALRTPTRVVGDL